MDIDISPIASRNVDVPFFIDFVNRNIARHSASTKEKRYREVAFRTSNSNNFKRFFEEIIPLKHFLEHKKSCFQMVKYMPGNQQWDAILDEDLDRKIKVEITKAQNPKKYYETLDLLEYGYAFSPPIQNMGKIGEIRTDTPEEFADLPTRTTPQGFEGEEHVDVAVSYILHAIEKKQTKEYPCGTILIVLLETDILFLKEDYSLLEQKISEFEKGIFSEIYVVENHMLKDFKPKWDFFL